MDVSSTPSLATNPTSSGERVEKSTTDATVACPLHVSEAAAERFGSGGVGPASTRVAPEERSVTSSESSCPFVRNNFTKPLRPEPTKMRGPLANGSATAFSAGASSLASDLLLLVLTPCSSPVPPAAPPSSPNKRLTTLGVRSMP